MNKTLCASLWMNYSLNPDGSVGLCCANKQVVDSKIHRQEIKQQMISGQAIDGCSVCYLEESVGKRSLRQQYNTQYLQNSINNYDIDYSNITHYDLSMSNKCNQRCRMCNSDFSTGWFKDSLRLKRDYNITMTMSDFNTDNREKRFQSQSDKINDIIDSMTNSQGQLTVKLKGGEPLYLEENIILLERMIELDLHLRTELLSITTNGTKYDNRLLQLIKRFPKTQFNISIDATGKLYEYIRGSNIEWEECVSKWKYLIPHADKITINNTIMIYNAFDYQNLIQFVKTELGDYNLNNYLLFGPRYLQVKLLSDHDRILLANSQYSNTSLYKFLIKPVTSQDFYSDLPLTETLSTIKTEFYNYSNALDLIRNERLYELVPELCNI